MQAIQSASLSTEEVIARCLAHGSEVVNQVRRSSLVSLAPETTHAELRRNVDAMLDEAALYPDVPLALF